MPGVDLDDAASTVQQLTCCTRRFQILNLVTVAIISPSPASHSLHGVSLSLSLNHRHRFFRLFSPFFVLVNVQQLNQLDSTSRYLCAVGRLLVARIHTHTREWRVLRFLQILTRENSGAVALLHRQHTHTHTTTTLHAHSAQDLDLPLTPLRCKTVSPFLPKFQQETCKLETIDSPRKTFWKWQTDRKTHTDHILLFFSQLVKQHHLVVAKKFQCQSRPVDRTNLHLLCVGSLSRVSVSFHFFFFFKF